jgi:hypothetical protein
VPELSDPQSLNRYSYVLNNPLRYADPTGHMQCEEYQGSCLSEKQATKLYKARIQKQPDKIAKKHKTPNEPEDTGPITELILQLPGSADAWSNVATGFDLLAWATDVYATGAVTYAGFAGAALPAPLIAAGLPEVPLATGLAGMAIAELYIQPVLFTGNLLATISTGATLVSDTKAGHTRIEELDFSSSSLNSMTLTDIGWMSNEAYLSLGIQSVAVANDFGWTSLPYPMIP